MEYLLGTLAVLAALAFVAYPLFRRSDHAPPSAEAPVPALAVGRA